MPTREEGLQRVLDRLEIGVFRVGPDGRLLHANQALCDLLGLPSPADARGLDLSALVPDQRALGELRRVLRREDHVHRHPITVLSVRGEPRTLSLSAATTTAQDGGSLIDGIVEDITDRIRAEEHLRSEREFSESLLTSLPGVFYLFNEQGRFLRWNGNFETVTGYSKEELAGMSPLDLFTGPDREHVAERIALAFREGSAWAEASIVSKAKTENPYYFTGVRIDSGGEPCLIGMGVDISELRSTEHTLQRRTEQLEILSRASREVNTVLEPDAILRRLVAFAISLVDGTSGAAGLMVDGRMVFSEYNQGGRTFPIDLEFATGHGVPGRVMATRKPYLSNDAETDPVVIQEIREQLGFYNLVDVPILGRDGRLIGCFEIHNSRSGRPFGSSDVAMLEGLAAAAAVAIENAAMVEQQHIAQEALRQAQKMEAIGRLAGGVAHDFNNLLQALLGLTETLSASVHDRDDLGSIAAELKEHIARGGSLTRQLLLFARREVARFESLDLNQVVGDLTRMLARLLRDNIHVELALSDAPCPVDADHGQLDQVLINLAVNASDALPDGGTVTVRTGWQSDESVYLEVEDSGCGMTDEVRRRVFEPFFTTKRASQGTGLGLAVVHGIVERHGGRIDIESREARGSRFRIVLPARTTPVGAAAVAEKPATASPPRGQDERVLLVEDEPAVRTSLVRILSSLGYRVTAVASGEEAELLPSEPAFDLLFSDVLLPGVSGPALAARLRDRWPGLAVILMSGHVDSELLRQSVGDPTVRFIQKPFDMGVIAREVSTALSPRPV